MLSADSDTMAARTHGSHGPERSSSDPGIKKRGSMGDAPAPAWNTDRSARADQIAPSLRCLDTDINYKFYFKYEFGDY